MGDTVGGLPDRVTADRYLGLVDEGILDPDDRVELLDGLIIAREPQNPWHASSLGWVEDALRAALGARALVTQQRPLVTGPMSVPEPDVFVVPGTRRDYLRRHPATAHLVVEISDSSFAQDRLTKSRIYAEAGIPEYWIVSRRRDRIEVMTDPSVSLRVYATTRIARRGETITLVAFPDVTLAIDDVMPPREEE
jgi:Uma2 family endonuclease